MKKQTLVFTAVLTGGLLLGGIAFALSGAGNGAEKAPEGGAVAVATPLPAKTKAKKEPAVRPQAKPGTKAEAILKGVLSQREMTEQEAITYNNRPDAIKEMTYEQARARQAELYEIIWGEGGSLENTSRADMDEYFHCLHYANAIATGNNWLAVRAEDLQTFIVGVRTDMKRYGSGEGDYKLLTDFEKDRYQYRVDLGLFAEAVLKDLAPAVFEKDGDYTLLAEALDFFEEKRGALSGSISSVHAEKISKQRSQYEKAVPLREVMQMG